MDFIFFFLVGLFGFPLLCVWVLFGFRLIVCVFCFIVFSMICFGFVFIFYFYFRLWVCSANYVFDEMLLCV